MVSCVGESVRLPFSSCVNKGIIDNKQCSYLIQRFYSQLLSYNLPANGEERRENAVFAGKNTMKQ